MQGKVERKVSCLLLEKMVVVAVVVVVVVAMKVMTTTATTTTTATMTTTMTMTMKVIYIKACQTHVEQCYPIIYNTPQYAENKGCMVVTFVTS